jgi:hypothetical protein
MNKNLRRAILISLEGGVLNHRGQQVFVCVLVLLKLDVKQNSSCKRYMTLTKKGGAASRGGAASKGGAAPSIMGAGVQP